MVFVSNSIEETQQLAMRLAKIIFPGTVIALVGELGTGKTTFTKGFAIQMGIKDHVTSPTFKLVSEYEGESCKLNHIDAYRLDGPNDFLNIGGEEYLTPKNSITIIEWGDILYDLLSNNVIRVVFERIKGQEESRKIKFFGVKTEF